jgi:biotin transport system substrate-specific component
MFVMEAIKKIEINKIFKIIIISILGSIVLTISAKIKIPLGPVPQTMQTFVVLFLGIAFGSRIGMLTVSLYLFEGIFGLPVFSGTPEKGIGLMYFTGPTMGYLIGFLIASYVAGSFQYNDIFKNHISKFFINYIKLILAVSVIYILGLLWLGNIIGWDKPVFKLGAEPFLLAESLKILILSIVAGKISKLRKII